MRDVEDHEDVAPQSYRVHPAMPAIMDLLGLRDCLRPGAATVIRRQRADGGHWRIEYIAQSDGTLGHLIKLRRNDIGTIERILTHKGVLEIDVHLQVPETVVAALAGRRLGDLLPVTGEAADVVISRVERRVKAQRQPLRIGFEPQAYVLIDDNG